MQVLVEETFTANIIVVVVIQSLLWCDE